MHFPEAQFKATCIQNTLTMSICVLTIGSETHHFSFLPFYCLKWEEQRNKKTAAKTMNKSEAKGLLQLSSEIYCATNNYIKK